VSSVFAWLDYDEAERRRMQEAVELFRERDTIDQLGIGSVRDAFSNLLFPGTSVLHTRARYFLFIPWIYRRLERAHVRSADVAGAARRDEIRLIDALLSGGEDRDVIGAQARADLKQLPSEAYWTGLRVLGLRLFPGTRAQYHRSFDAFRRAAHELPRDPSRSEHDEPVEDWARLSWDAGLDSLEPSELLDVTSFSLTSDEAEYLRDRIVRSVPDSLLAFLIKLPPAGPAALPWEHPAVGALPHALARELDFARIFSQVMWGAGLLYNLLLAEMTDSRDLMDHYTARVRDWAASLPAIPPGWSWDDFWHVALMGNPNLARAGRSRSFVEDWFAVVGALGEAVKDDTRARELVSIRERQVKGGQARLHSLAARERWNGASGAEQLSYRWPVVQRIVEDVQAALHPTGAAGARA
jgi:hypothetical protein